MGTHVRISWKLPVASLADIYSDLLPKAPLALQHPVAGESKAIHADQVICPRQTYIRDSKFYPGSEKDSWSLFISLLPLHHPCHTKDSSILSNLSANRRVPKVGRCTLILRVLHIPGI